MTHYQAPLRDMQFLLEEVFQAERFWQRHPPLDERIDAESARAILDACSKFAAQELAPLYRSGDESGCTLAQGQVTTPAGFSAAYQALAQGGWLGLSGHPGQGGQGMPRMLSSLFSEMVQGANMAFGLYPMLSMGVAKAIEEHASPELQQRFLPDLYTGRTAGAMCLTEPQAGSDLGLVRSIASPETDTTYRLSGTKIFITAGEHDLTDNIVHLVLARTPDAPAGHRGLSLFLVPKKLENGQSNGVSCSALEQKMGVKGSSTCVIHYDQAQAFRLGEEGEGLSRMFTLMNYERLEVGIQGLAVGEASYQCARDYAAERMQGRSASDPERAPAPILEHADVRRMLLNMKATTEAGRAFVLYVSKWLDICEHTQDPRQQQEAQQMVELLTPIAKAFLTDMGLDNSLSGQQVLGGHGYIREWGQEQRVRDVRISQIYEGTNGIQAMDLAGRKTVDVGGRLFDLFAHKIRAFFGAHRSEAMMEFTLPLVQTLGLLEDVTVWLLQQAKHDPHAVGAAAHDYLHLFGHCIYSYMWALMAKPALAGVARQDADAAFYQAKLETARFYNKRLLPQADALAHSIKTGSAPLYSLADDQF